MMSYTCGVHEHPTLHSADVCQASRERAERWHRATGWQDQEHEAGIEEARAGMTAARLEWFEQAHGADPIVAELLREVRRLRRERAK